MRYMPILPTGMFDVFKNSTARDAFILPQFWKNPDYRSFYTSMKWDHVIIDNALYEDKDGIPTDELIRIAMQLKTERCFIVAPEDLHSGVATASLTIEAVERHGLRHNQISEGKGPRWELMTILHEQPGEMKMQYKMMQDANIGHMPVGISIFSYRHGWDRASLKKFVGVGDSNYLHAFGLDNLLEVYNLRDAGFDSVDSSIVATAAFHEIDLMGEHWMIDRQYNKEFAQLPRVDLQCKDFDADCKRRTLYNIIKMREFVGNGRVP
jgi:hypothetical protein